MLSKRWYAYHLFVVIRRRGGVEVAHGSWGPACGVDGYEERPRVSAAFEGSLEEWDSRKEE